VTDDDLSSFSYENVPAFWNPQAFLMEIERQILQLLSCREVLNTLDRVGMRVRAAHMTLMKCQESNRCGNSNSLMGKKEE
jgi:hypothetical protein